MNVQVKGRVVEMPLDEFTDLMSTLDSAMETEEANEWLRKARMSLISDIAILERELRRQPEPNITVLRVKNGVRYYAQITSVQRSIDRICIEIADHGN